MRKQTASGILRFNTAKGSELLINSGIFAVYNNMVAAPPMFI